MEFPVSFYKATQEYNTFEKHVNAPYIRADYEFPASEKTYLTITGLGFYILTINGEDITKGLMAPYISNPDDIVYFDRYDITGLIKPGKNTIGIILGNGMQNAPGGRVWEFDIAPFRAAPCFAVSVTGVDGSGEETDTDIGDIFRCHPSPVVFDDIRSGCIYDANLEIEGWNLPGFDDSGWDKVIKAETPRGEKRICDTDPIKVTEEIAPVSVTETTLKLKVDNRENMRLNTQYDFSEFGEEAVMYDFGLNTSGVCRLKINGRKGQKIFIQFAETVFTDGRPNIRNTSCFYPEGYGQILMYTCKGGEEEFVPCFCYYGYRYAVVFGLEKEQAVPGTLTMLRANSDLRTRGGFECSDETMNKLGKMVNVSDLANFWYFPTDCPHREKNGWTGDAAVSAEHMMLTLTPERSYREWLRNICKAQNDAGALPGIVPTGGWGFEWGNGPAWDNVLTELCWQIYRMRGDLEPARECSDSMMRYLNYISKVRREDGLVAIGLGDWVQPGKGAGDPVSPLYVTDSVISMYISYKSYMLFKALGYGMQADFALSLYSSLRESIRKNLIDFSTMTVRSRCQTSQAICIYYGVFDDSEKKQAAEVLVRLVHEKGDHLDSGMIGLRTVFHVLSDAGYGSLAYKMITRDDFPSYGMMIRQGLTSMAEDFVKEEDWDSPNSLNHHFLGDFLSWFIQKVAGIRVNPRCKSPDDFDIKPDFIPQLSSAKAFYEAPCGKLSVSWVREGDRIRLDVDVPEGASGYIVMPEGWLFSYEENTYHRLDSSAIYGLESGSYLCKKID